MKYKLNKLAFDYIIELVKYKIITAFIQPGEMVGPIAAQSLGEVSTQLTLNSIEWNEKVMINQNGITKVVIADPM